jgi:hypothetical protein
MSSARKCFPNCPFETAREEETGGEKKLRTMKVVVVGRKTPSPTAFLRRIMGGGKRR